jgi:hypothetical protein
MALGDGVSRLSFKHAVDAWNSEIKDYHGEKIGQGNMSKYGHYTQVRD